MIAENKQRMRVDERRARRLILAQAIETADAQGKLLTDAEREQLDLRAVEMARAAAGAAGEIAVADALCERADLVLQAVEKRNASLTSLKDPPAWRPWLLWGAPIACLILGIATDRLANPHRVDLLSFPFFAICVWNLAVYAVLFVEMFRGGPGDGEPQWNALQRVVDGIPRYGWRTGRLRAEVAAQFLLRWQRATAALNGQRVRQLLHSCAAAWGAGVALSLFLYGLTVEYRIGWESTFLNAEQLHRILSFVFAPVVALFSLEPFTLQDIASMKLTPGSDGVAEHGRRWVYLYASLMLVVVVLPRSALAWFAAMRARSLARRVAIDADDPYFQRLIDQLRPASVTVWLCTHRPEDKSLLLKAIAQRINLGVNGTMATTTAGDSMRLADLPAVAVRAEAEAAEPVWKRALGLGGPQPDGAEGNDGDLIMHVVSEVADLESATPPLHEFGRPVLIVVNLPADPGASGLLAQCELHKRQHADIAAVLSFDEFGRCWVQERTLLDAIAKCTPRSKEQGVARLVNAWDSRNLARFNASMSALAAALLRASREAEEVRSAPLSLRHVFSKSHRDAHEQAKQNAMLAIVGRLQAVFAGAFADLMRLHGIEHATAALDEHRPEGSFDFRQAVDTPQAGMAGAATGAAMGASVDLMTGGLTLGMAALLGALVGGSAAFIGAAWKNRDSPSGVSTVQLSDAMLLTLVEASLLRYLAVIHFDRRDSLAAIGESRPAWTSEIVAAVASNRDMLIAAIETARDRRDAASLASATASLAGALEAVARRVLGALYPESRIRPS